MQTEKTEQDMQGTIKLTEDNTKCGNSLISIQIEKNQNVTKL